MLEFEGLNVGLVRRELRDHPGREVGEMLYDALRLAKKSVHHYLENRG